MGEANPLGGRAVNELNRDEARRALALLVDPACKVELRPLPSARSVLLPADNLDALVEAAANAEATGNTVYLVLNPVAPAPGRTACRDTDVPYRRWLFVDIDPERAAGAEKESATDEEKARAGATAAAIADWLAEQGCPTLITVDSGNGYYLWGRIDLPNSDHARQLIKRFIGRLKQRFDAPGVVVDSSVSNASRLAKLPGSLARKGEHSLERPHRRCRILHAPAEPEIIPAEFIQALAGTASATSGGSASANRGGPHSPFTNQAGGGNQNAYFQGALDRAFGRVCNAVPGPMEGRNNVLFKAAAGMAELVAGGLGSWSVVEDRLTRAAHIAGLEQPEIGRSLASAWRTGSQNPRGMPEAGPVPGPKAKATNGKATGHQNTGGAPADADEPVTYLASTVVPKKIEWLWPGRIPVGKLTTFAGLMGIGKTFLLCDIAARLSAGMAWPYLPDHKVEPAEVLFISGEDDPDDTLVPRLIECGAALDRIRFLHFNALVNFTLASLKILDRAAEEAAGKLRLVVIDPPTSYVGDVDDHKNAELRRLLTPLQHWSAEQRAAVIFNTHLNKGGGVKTEAIFRVIGSVAWMAAVRAGHLIALDPDDPEKRLFVPMKLNIGRKPVALAYTLAETGEDRARVNWLGPVDVTADQAVNREKAKPRRVVARDWLVERFKERREWRSDDLFHAARQENISRNAIFEAKGSLDLPKARRVVAENGDVEWVWWVPADWEPPATGKDKDKAAGQGGQANRQPEEDDAGEIEADAEEQGNRPGQAGQGG